MRLEYKAYSDLMRELWGSPRLWNVKKTYIEIARRLGVDEETVRNRIKHLKNTGFLLGWRLVPNPALLNRRSSFLLLELGNPDLKEEIISRLKLKDGVVTIVNFYGNNLLVSFFDDEEKTASKQVSKIRTKMKTLTVPQISVSEGSFQMTGNDWKICKSLLRNAERRVADVATEVKVSAKTVKRRLSKMMNSSAIAIMPMTNLKKGTWVSFHLVIQSQESKKTEVERLVTSRMDNLVFRADAQKNGSVFGFVGSNIAEGNEILKWVKQQPGVTFARMSIVEEVLYIFDWLEREIEERIKVTK